MLPSSETAYDHREKNHTNYRKYVTSSLRVALYLEFFFNSYG